MINKIFKSIKFYIHTISSSFIFLQDESKRVEVH